MRYNSVKTETVAADLSKDMRSGESDKKLRLLRGG